MQLIQKLKAAGVNMQQEIKAPPSEEQLFSHQTVVLTGSFPDHSREELAQLIREHGGKVTGSVSKKTSFLLAGEAAGSKYAKAESLGIPILTWEEFQDKFLSEHTDSEAE